MKWRLVLTGLENLGSVIANDRYVAILHGSAPGRLTLIDEQTGRRKQLSRPDCASPAPLMFGGQWLLVTCPGSPAPFVPATFQIYNLRNGHWAPFQVSPQCKGVCGPVAVGRYWVKLISDEGIPMYPPADYYLQNITTGQFKPDPATPGGPILDDLNAPSGSVPLCPPLQYPSDYTRGNEGGPYLGAVAFYGQFALTLGYELQGSPPYPGNQTWSLHRCRSKLNLVIDTNGTGPVASSRAVVVTRDNVTLHGWFLPSLRQFTIRTALRYLVEPVALTDRTIYIRTQTEYAHAQLWAATLPSPNHRSRH